MHLRRVPAGFRAGLIALVLLAAACGDDGGDDEGGGLGALVTTTTEDEVEETTTTTEADDDDGLFDDDGTGSPGSGLFGGDVGEHDADVDVDDIDDLDTGDPTEFYASADIDVDLANALHDACAGGDMQACDTMYLDTPADSDAEAFGATCGGALPSADAYCVTLGGDATGTYVPLGTPFAGTSTDETEQALLEACELGGMNACDALYVVSAQGTEAFAYGASCGGRIETTSYCTDLYSLGYDYHQAWLASVGLVG